MQKKLLVIASLLFIAFLAFSSCDKNHYLCACESYGDGTSHIVRHKLMDKNDNLGCELMEDSMKIEFKERLDRNPKMNITCILRMDRQP